MMTDLWKSMGFKWHFRWCGVGSREVPEEDGKFLIWAGRCMALLGGVLSTGDAIGSDFLFLSGYLAGKDVSMPPAQIYFTRLKNQRNLPHDPVIGCHEAEQYDTHEESKAMAFRARGSFEGLFPSGIGLHSRNPMQVLSETLLDPVWVILFYARPVGKQGKVDGGTNTAVQVAIMNDIKKVNLYLEEERVKFKSWVEAQLTKRNIPIPALE
ncbi:hypothetical protein D9M68_19330 [compost metagenome]